MELTARDAVAAGVGRIVLVTNEETGAEVEARMRSVARRAGFASMVRIDAVVQRVTDVPAGLGVPRDRVRPWGTAHAVRAARTLLARTDAPVVVANADDWYGPDAISRIVRWADDAATPTTAALVPYPLALVMPAAVGGAPERPRLELHREECERPLGVSRGLLRLDEAGRVVDVVEHLHVRRAPGDSGVAVGVAPDGSTARIPLDRLCSMNLWAFGPGIWSLLEDAFRSFLTTPGRRHDPVSEWLLPDVVRAGIRADRLKVFTLPPGSRHLGVTHPEDRARVRDALASVIDH